MAHPKRAGRPRLDRMAGTDMKFFIDSADLGELRDLAGTCST
jgi:hypothetical protein